MLGTNGHSGTPEKACSSKTPPQVDGRVANGRREGNHPIIVWIVLSANDRGEKGYIGGRVWQVKLVNQIVLDSATQGGKL